MLFSAGFQTGFRIVSKKFSDWLQSHFLAQKEMIVHLWWSYPPDWRIRSSKRHMVEAHAKCLAWNQEGMTSKVSAKPPRVTIGQAAWSMSDDIFNTFSFTLAVVVLCLDCPALVLVGSCHGSMSWNSVSKSPDWNAIVLLARLSGLDGTQNASIREGGLRNASNKSRPRERRQDP